jgi:S-DNA-T family DNA segregation ATPase FtsK/SpoIIIE
LRAMSAPVYLEDILDGPSAPIPGLPGEGGEGEDGGGDPEQDPLYDEAVRIVTESRKASISGVQRRLKIGYNRAARMIEAMEAAGLVGTLQSNGSREVLAPPPPESD